MKIHIEIEFDENSIEDVQEAFLWLKEQILDLHWDINDVKHI